MKPGGPPFMQRFYELRTEDSIHRGKEATRLETMLNQGLYQSRWTLPNFWKKKEEIQLNINV